MNIYYYVTILESSVYRSPMIGAWTNIFLSIQGYVHVPTYRTIRCIRSGCKLEHVTIHSEPCVLTHGLSICCDYSVARAVTKIFPVCDSSLRNENRKPIIIAVKWPVHVKWESIRATIRMCFHDSATHVPPMRLKCEFSSNEIQVLCTLYWRQSRSVHNIHSDDRF